MKKEDIARRIVEVGIVPVVRAWSAELAMTAARAVIEGGIPIIELTMTVPGAVDAIRELKKSMGADVLIGAGTVLDVDSAAECLDAGAEFLVSPGFDRETVEFAKRKEKLIMAGALTPTEVITAWKAGCDFVKIFPCGNVGGASYIRALKSALPQIPMVPTGGVNMGTAEDFLRAGASALGIGGELVSAPALRTGNFAAITEAARSYLAIVGAVRCTAQEAG